MSYRLTLAAVLSAFMLLLAACDVDGNGDDSGATVDDRIEDVDDDEAISPDDAVIEDDNDADEEPASDDQDQVAAKESEATEENVEEEAAETADEATTEEEHEEANDETDAEPAIDPDVGTRENPIPTGESAQIGDWVIQVIDTTPDATQIVMDENQFNDPSTEGNQFFIARISATYEGDESGTFWLDVRLRAVDDGGVAYEGMDARCGVIPDNIQDSGEAFTGATIEGNTCWSVSSDHTDSLVMIVEPMFSWERERIFFALNE
jgi:hypothetical protein